MFRLVTLLSLIQCNEAARMMTRSQTRARAHAQRQIDVADMPMDRALEILHARSSDDFTSFVQAHVHHHKSHLHSHLHHKRNHLKHLRRKGVPQPDEGAAYGTGTKNAVVKINEMILETVDKMDAEDIRCEARFEELEQLITEIGEDMNTFQVSSTEATAKKLDAYGEISDYGVFISQTRGELDEHKSKCQGEKDDLHGQLKIIKSDMGVMEKILKMTKCNDETYNAATLLQCTDHTGGHYTRIKAVKGLKEQLDKLRHASSRQLIDNQIIVADDGADDSPMVLVEQGHKRQEITQRAVPQGLYGSLNTSDGAVTYPDQPEKCSISNSTHCPELRERFMNIAGGIADAQEEMEAMIGNQQSRCLTLRGNIEREIEHYQIYLRQQQQKEAQAGADFTDAQSATTKKEVEQRDTQNSLKEEREHCTAVNKEYKNEECALNKIRDQLLNMSNLERHIVDCEVTNPWEYGACSASCAGGQRTLSRDVDVQPGPGPELWQKGHLCPAQQAIQMCNTDRCPVDCLLSDWGEWGQCSKVCDGGSRERGRKIKIQKVAAGMPCESKIETEDCNMESCTKDCVLNDWTDWSTTCSKQCGTGQQTRYKTLAVAAEAGGKCAHFYDGSRFGTTKCNEDACPHTKDWVTCRAKVDVVIMIDGSASMAAGGFLAAKTFASNFAKALSAPAQVASMVFSGPDDIDTLNTCEGLTAGDATIEQCGMNWISHLTTDYATVATGTMAADFPASSALTAMALDLAAAEFVSGHRSSQSVAILITDGTPVRKFPMAQATAHLKKTARFMEIVVGRDAYADAAEFKGWGSDPWYENVRFVNGWDDLTSSNATLNSVIEDFCADMVFDTA